MKRLLPVIFSLSFLFVASLSASALSTPPTTDTDAPIFGVRGPCGRPDSAVTIDPATARETVVGAVASEGYAFNCTAWAFDGTSFYVQRSYIPTAGSELVAIDADTGEISVRGPFPGGYIALSFDPNRGVLVAMKALSDDKNSVVWVDPATAQETLIVTLGGPTYGYGASAYSPDAGELYLVQSTMFDAGQRLIAVNVVTGEIEDRGALPSGYIHLEYSSSARALFGLSNLRNGANEFVRIDPATAQETSLGNVGGEAFWFVSGASALDDTTNTFYALRADAGGSAVKLLAVDTRTGEEVERGPLGARYSYLGATQQNEVNLPLVRR